MGDIKDNRGCPLPGLATDMDKDFNFAVGRSRKALKRIHQILDPFCRGGGDLGIEVWREVVRKSFVYQ